MVKIFVISETSRTPEVGRANPVDATLTTGAAFQVNNAKPCIPVFTLSINDTFKFLEHLKQEFRRTTYWSKYISEITTQSKKKKKKCCVTDPTFKNINRLFVLCSKM